MGSFGVETVFKSVTTRVSVGEYALFTDKIRPFFRRQIFSLESRRKCNYPLPTTVNYEQFFKRKLSDVFLRTF